MEAKGVQITPIGVARGEFDDAGFEHEAEQQKAISPDEPGRAGEEREKAAFQQECVPLEAGEGLTGGGERQIEDET